MSAKISFFNYTFYVIIDQIKLFYNKCKFNLLI